MRTDGKRDTWKTKNPVYSSLLRILDVWGDSYCYTADDGSEFFSALMDGIRTICNLPEDFECAEVREWLANQ